MSQSQALEVLQDQHDLSLSPQDPYAPFLNSRQGSDDTRSARQFVGAARPVPVSIGPDQSQAMTGVSEHVLTAGAQMPPDSIGRQDSITRQFVRFSAPAEHLRVLQKWEGTVESIKGREFTARIVDRTNPDNPVEFMTLSLDEIAPPDLELLHPGAVFYWAIGYRERRDGHRERASSIRFQRLPAWTARARAEAKEESHRLAQELGWT